MGVAPSGLYGEDGAVGEKAAESESECRCSSNKCSAAVSTYHQDLNTVAAVGWPTPGPALTCTAVQKGWLLYIWLLAPPSVPRKSSAPALHGPWPQVFPAPVMPVPTICVTSAAGNCSFRPSRMVTELLFWTRKSANREQTPQPSLRQSGAQW
eukprot:SAG22_NODE_764_length_7397_cov_6.955604_7_plen_153_part_00